MPPYRGPGTDAALYGRGGGGGGGGGYDGGSGHPSYLIEEAGHPPGGSLSSLSSFRPGMKRPEPSSGRGSEDGGDSDREDDRKRRWMTKDQARVRGWLVGVVCLSVFVCVLFGRFVSCCIGLYCRRACVCSLLHVAACWCRPGSRP
jgi:hypothetical protein